RHGWPSQHHFRRIRGFVDLDAVPRSAATGVPSGGQRPRRNLQQRPGLVHGRLRQGRLSPADHTQFGLRIRADLRRQSAGLRREN
ncbi:hypothetical protein AAVH_40362, partial [Aphelenchoides avenae]